MYMADTLPCRGISEVRVFKGGVTVPFTSAMDKKGPLLEIKAGSKTSPGINVTGKVSGVDLNSWWPYSQKSDEYIINIHQLLEMYEKKSVYLAEYQKQ